MRPDPDLIEASRPGDEAVALLAAEVRRLQAVISSTADRQAHTDWLRHAFADQKIRTLRAEEAIRRVADQDATLSVQGGSVTVTMDATLADAEREAIERSIETLGGVEDLHPTASEADAAAVATLRNLLERTK